jgi:hypothetical protein
MTNPRPRPRSIMLKGSPQTRVYRTFDDWQTEQKADLRTPEQRGIHIGSPVMWRYRENQVIITERAIVAGIDDQTLTLLVKGVQTRTCSANINEIVDSHFGHLSLAQANRSAYIANQIESPNEKSVVYTSDDSPGIASW